MAYSPVMAIKPLNRRNYEKKYTCNSVADFKSDRECEFNQKY